MNLSRLFNIIRVAHPFSSVMASSVIGILMIRLHRSMIDTLILISIILAIQFVTGLLNDYLDFELDEQYQHTKPLVKGEIDKQTVKIMILVLSMYALISSIMFFPVEIVAIIILGALIAQSYNLGLQYTPLSLPVFASSFGLMALIPFALDDQFTLIALPLPFLITGGCIASLLHITNDLIDYETDSQQDINSFVIWIGKSRSIGLVILLGLIILVVNILNPFIFILTVVTIFLIALGMRRPSINEKEMVYYLSVCIFVIILMIIPI